MYVAAFFYSQPKRKGGKRKPREFIGKENEERVLKV
jgi:hypothetical protein